MSRRYPVLGFILALLSIGFAVAASAGDATPGKLLYAKGANWRSEINIAAPLDSALSFNLAGCVPIGPNPCQGINIPKGGAKTFSAAFVHDWIDGAVIGVIDVPAGAWSASSFLVFDDGKSHTAFTAPTLRDVLSSSADNYRAGVAASNADKTTCSTFYNESAMSTAVQVTSYGANGEPAKTKDGSPAPIDVYIVPSHVATQGCLGDHLNKDGSVASFGPAFDAGSVRIAFGCAGVGPCPDPQRTWFIVTKGPSTGATVETLPVQNVGAAPATPASVQSEAIATTGETRGVLIRLHGPASAELTKAIDRHNADVERMRAAER